MHTNDEKPELAFAAEMLRFLDTVPSEGWRGTGRSGGNAESLKDGSGSACPSPASYMSVVLGTAEGSVNAALLEHAAACSACAGLLAATLRVFDDNPSAEETAMNAALMKDAAWPAELAATMAKTQARKRPFLAMSGLTGGGARGWLMAGAAAAILAAISGILWQRHTSAPENLLARAYEQSRTLELRIPEAGYSTLTALTHTRGAGGDDEPAPLLEARAGLARDLQSAPGNTHLQELEARADVMAEHYDRAIDVLDRLLADGPVTAELLTDAAAAYYQRGLVSNRELDRSTALEYLRRADEIAPTDPVVLFNEALVMQDRGQMMNAVEVWNRYLTVERDKAWAAEGKRKLEALEATLNRLKNHQSRLEEILASPVGMIAAAADAGTLAEYDEQLSTLQLMRLTEMAFPDPRPGAPASQARGSPCDGQCQAARKLLQATGRSLERQHQDFWLSDLLPTDIDSFPESTRLAYARGMRLLGKAAYENQAESPAAGIGLASEAREIFAHLQAESGGNASFRRAMIAGQDRASVEVLYGMQRTVDFRGCREFAQQLHAQAAFWLAGARYPWIEGMEQGAEKVCYDEPAMRAERERLGASALRIAQDSRYLELAARVKLRNACDIQNAGDDEAFEHQLLAIFHELIAANASPNRIANTFDTFPFSEENSSRTRMVALSLRETVNWAEFAKDKTMAAQFRILLTDADIRMGAMTDARQEMQRAYAEANAGRDGESKTIKLPEGLLDMAEALLERGDSSGAAGYLDQFSAQAADTSDVWQLRRYTAARGQLLLAQGKYDEAAHLLEDEIRSLEGTKRNNGGSNAAEYGKQDHDLYGELAAAWLGQGRPAVMVLALWERFRLRSRGLTIPECPEHGLDCESENVLAAASGLDGRVLTGQIVLLDRVMVYRMDGETRTDGQTVHWSVRQVKRHDVLDAAQSFERAVSSPAAPSSTTMRVGGMLRDVLLPELKPGPNAAPELFLEPDALLENLAWAVLPTAAGPLGMRYGLAETGSILDPDPEAGRRDAAGGGLSSEKALVVGASIAGAGAAPLPEALHEARMVDGFLRSPQLLMGQQATPARVAQALGTATVFHFAGHAVGGRAGTELLLAPGSAGDARPWIDAAFLRQHPLRECRLAVLSACATGALETSWKDPLDDLVEALNQSGVPEVVATRWQVDSQASVSFMEAFYRSLREGSSVAWALTQARRVQSRNSSYSNPYYWGAYYVSGKESVRAQEVLRASLTKTAQ